MTVTSTLRTRVPTAIDGGEYVARAICPFTEQHTEATGEPIATCSFSELHKDTDYAASALSAHLSEMHAAVELAALFVRHFPGSISTLRLVPER